MVLKLLHRTKSVHLMSDSHTVCVVCSLAYHKLYAYTPQYLLYIETVSPPLPPPCCNEQLTIRYNLGCISYTTNTTGISSYKAYRKSCTPGIDANVHRNCQHHVTNKGLQPFIPHVPRALPPPENFSAKSFPPLSSLETIKYPNEQINRNGWNS